MVGRARLSFTIAIFLAALVLLAAAAPTCLDRNANTVRCDVGAAMPVGWTPLPGRRAHFAVPDPAQIASALIAIGLLPALFALLPAFDSDNGWTSDD